MTVGHEGGSFMHGEFESQPEAFATQDNQLQKYGEAILRNTDSSEEALPTALEGGRYQYQRFDQSQVSAAIERTDISDPKQPYIDF